MPLTLVQLIGNVPLHVGPEGGVASGPLNQGPQPPALALLLPPGLPAPLRCPARGAWAAVGDKARRLLHTQPFALCSSEPVSTVGAEGGALG